jgi:hypothetical protein
VAIARAIVSDPTLLVCDEPTGDLDRQSAAEVLTLLQQLNRDHGKTIIMVTHDPKAAEFAATRCTSTRARWWTAASASGGVKYLQLVWAALLRRKTRTSSRCCRCSRRSCCSGCWIRCAALSRAPAAAGRPDAAGHDLEDQLHAALPKSLLERIQRAAGRRRR